MKNNIKTKYFIPHRCYSSIWIEKTSLIQYNKVSGRYLYEGKNTNH